MPWNRRSQLFSPPARPPTDHCAVVVLLRDSEIGGARSSPRDQVWPLRIDGCRPANSGVLSISSHHPLLLLAWWVNSWLCAQTTAFTTEASERVDR